MASLDELGQLTDAETADLRSRVERFRSEWQPDGTTGLAWYLPPLGTRSRLAVLVAIIQADMELRAPAGLPFHLESYLTAYAEDLTAETVPVELLVGEYKLRHQFTDKPAPDGYHARFPALYEDFTRRVSGEHAQRTVRPGDPTRPTSVDVVPPQPSPPTPPGHIGDLVGTGPVSMNQTPHPGEGSTVLLTDTPYQLVRKLGSGAFGEVYEALAPGGIRVAIKRILRTVDHPASKSERDALDAIKLLSHPFLLKTNAYWVFDDRLVIVMELAEGSLADRIEHHQSQGRIGVPPEELLPLFEQASEALDYLHSQNVSHRDVKPENILILRGYAKVGDFGLARLHEHAMTLVQDTVGTPAYMAPEMWRQKVSLQSDQYALAATYVRARLGRFLFTTNVLVDLANFHINETPNLDPLPVTEQKVLLKALAKDPEHRYRSCTEFTKALREAVFPAPPPAKPVPPNGGRRGMLIGMLAVAVTSALAVGLVNWFTQKRDNGAQNAPPTAPSDNKQQPPIVAPPPKPKPWTPTDWEPVSEAGIEAPSAYMRDELYRKLTREVNGERLVAVLIPSTRPGDPKAFYMLENKITNHVFSHVWSEGLKDNSSALFQFSKQRPDLVPGKWRDGFTNFDGKQLGSEGPQAGVPVLGVTLPEAVLVAERLGGFIPTHTQWLKAVGKMGDGPNPGPAGTVLKKGSAEEKRKELMERNLALGLKNGPWPVSRRTSDVSYAKIHQLVTNGAEWVDREEEGKRINLANLPPGPRDGRYVGEAPNELNVQTFDTMSYREVPWDTVTDVYAGFRIVLEPR